LPVYSHPPAALSVPHAVRAIFGANLARKIQFGCDKPFAIEAVEKSLMIVFRVHAEFARSGSDYRADLPAAESIRLGICCESLLATLIAPLAVPTHRLRWLSSAKDQTRGSVNSSLLKVTPILRLALSAFGSNSANPQSAPIQNLPSAASYNDPTRTHPRPSLV